MSTRHLLRASAKTAGKPNQSPTWSYNLHSRSNCDEEDSDEETPPSSQLRISEDARLMRDLDLASRKDEAVYKPNPWTIAKANAASRPSVPTAGLARTSNAQPSQGKAVAPVVNRSAANLGLRKQHLTSSRPNYNPLTHLPRSGGPQRRSSRNTERHKRVPTTVSQNVTSKTNPAPATLTAQCLTTSEANRFVSTPLAVVASVQESTAAPEQLVAPKHAHIPCLATEVEGTAVLQGPESSVVDPATERHLSRTDYTLPSNTDKSSQHPSQEVATACLPDEIDALTQAPLSAHETSPHEVDSRGHSVHSPDHQGGVRRVAYMRLISPQSSPIRSTERPLSMSLDREAASSPIRGSHTFRRYTRGIMPQREQNNVGVDGRLRTSNRYGMTSPNSSVAEAGWLPRRKRHLVESPPPEKTFARSSPPSRKRDAYEAFPSSPDSGSELGPKSVRRDLRSSNCHRLSSSLGPAISRTSAVGRD
ncbi:hypothetical protein K474DRAFT_257280 [Panus rudis PR-1116 ss-1]|nr:hypothetical protein K474DRAFT_257280 [Panus rudis PR-1116 ss-1]